MVLLGAGGAGAAVAHALLTLGTSRLTVLDVDPRRARGLAASLCGRFGNGRAAGDDLAQLATHVEAADGLVHATPTGMAAHPGLPLPAELLRPDLWVADIVYRPLETALVRTAREIGCRVLDGGGMAVFQAVDAFRLFTGVEPDADRMLAHFAGLVGSTETDLRVGWNVMSLGGRTPAARSRRSACPARWRTSWPRRRRPVSTASRSSSPTWSRRRGRRRSWPRAAPTWACRSTSTSRSGTSTPPTPTGSPATCAAPSGSST